MAGSGCWAARLATRGPASALKELCRSARIVHLRGARGSPERALQRAPRVGDDAPSADRWRRAIGQPAPELGAVARDDGGGRSSERLEMPTVAWPVPAVMGYGRSTEHPRRVGPPGRWRSSCPEMVHTPREVAHDEGSETRHYPWLDALCIHELRTQRAGRRLDTHGERDERRRIVGCEQRFGRRSTRGLTGRLERERGPGNGFGRRLGRGRGWCRSGRGQRSGWRRRRGRWGEWRWRRPDGRLRWCRKLWRGRNRDRYARRRGRQLRDGRHRRRGRRRGRLGPGRLGRGRQRGRFGPGRRVWCADLWLGRNMLRAGGRRRSDRVVPPGGLRVPRRRDYRVHRGELFRRAALLSIARRHGDRLRDPSPMLGWCQHRLVRQQQRLPRGSQVLLSLDRHQHLPTVWLSPKLRPRGHEAVLPRRPSKRRMMPASARGASPRRPARTRRRRRLPRHLDGSRSFADRHHVGLCGKGHHRNDGLYVQRPNLDCAVAVVSRATVSVSRDRTRHAGSMRRWRRLNRGIMGSVHKAMLIVTFLASLSGCALTRLNGCLRLAACGQLAAYACDDELICADAEGRTMRSEPVSSSHDPCHICEAGLR